MTKSRDNLDNSTDDLQDGAPSQEQPETKETKKTAPRKKVATKKKAAGNSAETDVSEFQSAIRQMEQQNRERAEAQEAKFGHLMSGLDKAFQGIRSNNQERDQSNASSLDKLSQTIILSSEELRKEYEEMERLQEKKLVAEKEQHQYSFNMIKIIAVPAILLALLGIGYMFYTVSVMERAMTTMSKDMGAMRVSVGEMSTHVGSMSGSVQTMSENMQGMRQDLNILTRNVAPAMDGMRQMMPWSP